MQVEDTYDISVKASLMLARHCGQEIEGNDLQWLVPGRKEAWAPEILEGTFFLSEEEPCSRYFA